MSREDAIKVEGVILEVMPNRTCRVALANGHQLTAFAPGKARMHLARFVPGDKVMLEMSLYDLSEGRVIVEPKNDL